MDELVKHYPEHISVLQTRSKEALQRENLHGFIIHSGQELNAFLDDYAYPFKVNPHFKAWLPLTNLPHCWLIINGEDKPVLIYYQPSDLWHMTEALNEHFWNPHFTIHVIGHPTDVDKFLPNDKKGFAYIGAHVEVAKALGFEFINPEGCLHYLHYNRAYKTQYEQACMRRSNKIAVKGHLAVKSANLASASEWDILQIYLKAIAQSENETPYSSIIALNKNASVLHYTQRSKEVPHTHQSFLIDAGANFNGYASDITRTYSFKKDKFADLIIRMDNLLLNTVNSLKPGMSYTDLHMQAYREVGCVLAEFDLIKVSPEVAFDAGIISTFFPHGLGHHLGLQTHDVGGFISDERGTHIDPPKNHPFLRTTRKIEANQVFTIEPGLYFIDFLLDKLKVSKNAGMIHWKHVDEMRAFGGIRVEDNIIVHQSTNENMTRDLAL